MGIFCSLIEIINMLSPTYLSVDDRTRLVDINQSLLGAHTTEEATELRSEQQVIMGKSRTIQECTLPELSELRSQLFTQYQKHVALGSSQLRLIQSYIQQVEYREMMINLHKVDEPEESEEVKKAKTKSKARTSSYSWTIDNSHE